MRARNSTWSLILLTCSGVFPGLLFSARGANTASAATSAPGERTPRPLAPRVQMAGVRYGDGYDYPDGTVGLVVAKEDPKSIYPIARHGDGWFLVYEEGVGRPFWCKYVAWKDEAAVRKAVPNIVVPDLLPPDLSDLPALELIVTVTGTVKSKAACPGCITRGFESPLKGSRVVSQLAPGTKVRALALSAPPPLMIAEEKYILLSAVGSPSPMWIPDWESSHITWDGREYYDLEKALTVLPPRLARPFAAPPVDLARDSTTAGEPSLPPSPSPPQIFVRTEAGLPHPWQQQLPAQWQAADMASAGLIATVRDAPELVDVCRYMPIGLVYRVRAGYRVALSRKDAGLLAREVFYGKDPSGCPGRHSTKDPSWLEGKAPDVARFVEWLEKRGKLSHTRPSGP